MLLAKQVAVSPNAQEIPMSHGQQARGKQTVAGPMLFLLKTEQNAFLSKAEKEAVAPDLLTNT